MTKIRTGPDHTDHKYGIRFMDHGLCFSKNLPFHRPGFLVFTPDAHVITGTLPFPKPKELGRRISNSKFESLIVIYIHVSWHVGSVFRVMGPVHPGFWV